MAKSFVGCFYFKKTKSGNLIGEFLNNGSHIINVESATLKNSTGVYEGDYDSNWYDIESHNATLKISKINNNKYEVTWAEPGKTGYEGEGMLVDDLLIGYYRES